MYVSYAAYIHLDRRQVAPVFEFGEYDYKIESLEGIVKVNTFLGCFNDTNFNDLTG